MTEPNNPKQIPTAEEFVEQLFIDSFADTFESPRHDPIVKAMIEFAKMHVERLLRMDDYYLEEDIQEKLSNIK